MLFLFVVLSAQLLLVPVAESLENERLCEFLVEYSSSDEKNDWKWNRLAYAIEKGYVDVASFLIDRGEVIEKYKELSKDSRGMNTNYYKHPLVTAIRHGYNDLAIEMLQMGVDFSKAEEYKTVSRKVGNIQKIVEIERKPAFLVAMSEGKEDLSLIQAFFESGLNIDNSIIFQGKTYDENWKMSSYPLHLAIEYKKLKVARLFLNLGANTEYGSCGPVMGTDRFACGVTSLYLAVEGNSKDGAVLLLEYGADPLNSSTDNRSPLELAIERGYDDLVELLLDFI